MTSAKVFALVSACGGSGRSTVAANLAGMIARRGREVLAVDLDPRNALGLHLGLPLAETDGWAARALRAENWTDAAFRNSDGVRILPFGRLGLDDISALEDRLSGDRGWLRQRLAEISLAPGAVVLIDTPRLPSQLARQAIEAAQLVVNVMHADTASYAGLGLVREAAGGRSLVHVANQVEATHALQGDVLQLLRHDLEGRMAPPVHRDLAVPESVAVNVGLAEHAPHSQATHDFQGLASWLLELGGGA